jgi:hypothetical protein
MSVRSILERIVKPFLVIVMILPSLNTFAHNHNLNGYWRNELDHKSLIHVDRQVVSILNGDAKLSMDFKPDPTIMDTYHFNNLRFNRMALPASLPNISLTTAMRYISLLKTYGATITISNNSAHHQSIIVFWRVQDRSGSFILERVM